MAKLTVSLLLVAGISAGLIAGLIGAPSSVGQNDQTNEQTPQYGEGARILENAFNPAMQKMVRASMDLAMQLNQMARTDLPPEIGHKFHHSFESAEHQTKSLKLQYSLLLGLILWPLALIVCPLGCCIGCIVCCVVGVVTVLVVIVLLAVGTILYSGPLAGMLPHDATHVMSALVDTLGAVSNEALKAASELIHDGHLSQVAPVLGMLEQAVSAFGGIEEQLKQILEHPNLSKEMASEVYEVLRSVLEHLASLHYQTENLSDKLPISAQGLNETLTRFAQHIQTMLAQIEN